MTYNDVDDDRRADDGSDCIQWDNAGIAGQDADQVAKKGYGSTAQNGDGQQRVVVGRAQQHAGHMGDGQADESHRTAKGSSDGGEQAGYYQQPVAYAADVHSQVLGIPFTQTAPPRPWQRN